MGEVGYRKDSCVEIFVKNVGVQFKRVKFVPRNNFRRVHYNIITINVVFNFGIF